MPWNFAWWFWFSWNLITLQAVTKGLNLGFGCKILLVTIQKIFCSQKSTANVRIVKQYRTPLNIKNNLEIFNPNQNQVYLSRKMRHQACQENETVNTNRYKLRRGRCSDSLSCEIFGSINFNFIWLMKEALMYSCLKIKFMSLTVSDTSLSA